MTSKPWRAGVAAAPIVVNVKADAPAPAPAPTTSASKQIYAYANGNPGMHASTDQNPWSAVGWTLVGPAYGLAADANLGESGGYTLYYDSVDPNCEGQAGANSTQIGFIYATSQTGTVALYRYVNDWTVDHVSSTDPNLASQLGVGWRSEDVRGYVPTN